MGERLLRLRWRLGAWLLRPRLRIIHDHYEQAADSASVVNDEDRYLTCTGIVLGVRRAAQWWRPLPAGDSPEEQEG